MPDYQQGDVVSSFSTPSGAARGTEADGSGFVWTTDNSTDIIYKHNRTGSVLSSFAAPSNNPHGLGIDGSGCLWNAQALSPTDLIYKVDQSGSVGSTIGAPGDAPEGLGLDPSGFIWHADGVGTIYKLNTSGSVLSSFSTPSDTPKGVGVDSAGSLWHSDSGTDKLYRLRQSGAVVASFQRPAGLPEGVGLDPSGFIWHADAFQDAVYQIAAEGVGLGKATKPTIAASPRSVTPSTLAQAVATKPTMTATATVTDPALAESASASKPTVRVTPRTATGSALAEAVATKPTVTATARGVTAYADQPLIDGAPIGEDVSQVLRHDEIELEIRADQATLDAVLRDLQDAAGKYEQVTEPSGDFTVADSTSGTPTNTFRYTPRYAELPVVTAQDVVADAYSERPAAKAHDTFRVTVTLKPTSNVAPETGLIDESGGASDWVFETYAGAIATERVRLDTEAEADAGVLGFVLRVFLDETQAHALRTATGRQAAVGTSGSERSDADAVDNAPNAENTLTLTPRSDEQIGEGRYVIRDVELDRLDPDGTWYAARVEVVPAAVGARGTVGGGQVGEFEPGES